MRSLWSFRAETISSTSGYTAARPRSMTLCPPILITVASGRIRKFVAASTAPASSGSVSERCIRSASSSAVVFAMTKTPFFCASPTGNAKQAAWEEPASRAKQVRFINLSRRVIACHGPVRKTQSGPPRRAGLPLASVPDDHGGRDLARWRLERRAASRRGERAGIQLRLTAARHQHQGARLDLPVAGNRKRHLGIALQSGPATFVRIDETGLNFLAQALDVFIQTIGLE